MSSLVRFGSFEVDLAAGQLRRRGLRVRLRDQPFQVLASLLEHPGEVVTREELQRRLWRGAVFVDFENSLNIAVARLRTALGDSAGRPRYIETLPKRGYRFIGDVLASPAKAESAAAKPRLLVLPFANLSGDPAQEHFADAITDEVITALACLAPEHLAVLARTTAMHYKGTRKDAARIARELAVDYIVEGTVRVAEHDFSVNVQLVRASEASHLFAAKYEAPLRDIFQLQTAIAHGLADHIPAIAPELRQHPGVRRSTENIAAYTEYSKARHAMWQGTPAAMARAKSHFEAALQHDPGFALACDGLANLHWYLGFWGFLPPEEAEPIRRFYALRAIELDPALPETRCLTAFHPEKTTYRGACSYNWMETLREMAHVRELYPHSLLIHVRYASVLMVLGRTQEAVAELEAALESDPLSVEVRFWLAFALFFGRRFDEALDQCRKMLSIAPEHQVAFMVLGMVCLAMHRFDEAVAALCRAASLSRDLPLMLGWLGLAYGMAGRRAQAEQVLSRLRRIARRHFVLPSSFAWTHLGLGQVDEAFLWLERAVKHNDGWVPALKSYPWMDPFREDRRFRAVLAKLNLA